MNVNILLNTYTLTYIIFRSSNFMYSSDDSFLTVYHLDPFLVKTRPQVTMVGLSETLDNANSTSVNSRGNSLRHSAHPRLLWFLAKDDAFFRFAVSTSTELLLRRFTVWRKKSLNVMFVYREVVFLSLGWGGQGTT